MTIPDQPSMFRPEPGGVRPWWWRLTTFAGAAAAVEGELADRRFASQADAESWVGEFWPQLVEAGVDEVTLYDGDRAVYGPMSLHPS